MDLYLTPIARVGGNDQPGLYSLKIAEPTSKAIRSRKIDRLVLYMVMTGDLTLRQDQQDQLLTYLTEFYFQKSGSATAAMRSTAEELNKILLEINLRYAKKGQQVIDNNSYYHNFNKWSNRIKNIHSNFFLILLSYILKDFLKNT